MKYSGVEKTSPLYEYWRSSQSDQQEKLRLSIANPNSRASGLFLKEPYKWENLFQSVVREIMRGDYDSIYAMRILLDTVTTSTREKIMLAFVKEGLFDDSVIQKIQDVNYSQPKKKDRFRFLRILVVIFTNPYGLIIRRRKNHIYEFTGSFLNIFVMNTLGIFTRNKDKA